MNYKLRLLLLWQSELFMKTLLQAYSAKGSPQDDFSQPLGPGSNCKVGSNYFWHLPTSDPVPCSHLLFWNQVFSRLIKSLWFPKLYSESFHSPLPCIKGPQCPWLLYSHASCTHTHTHRVSEGSFLTGSRSFILRCV